MIKNFNYDSLCKNKDSFFCKECKIRYEQICGTIPIIKYILESNNTKKINNLVEILAKYGLKEDR